MSNLDDRIAASDSLDAGRLARELAAAIVANSDDAIVSKSLDGTVLSWNAGAERIFGYTAIEMIGRPITLLFPEDRLHEEAYFISRIRAGEQVSHFETRRLHKDGRVLDVSVSLSPVRNHDGEIVAISKIARDITERVSNRAEIERQRELLSITLSCIADAVVTTNTDGVIEWMNPAAERMTGWTTDSAMGLSIRSVFQIINEHDRSRAPCPVARCLAERKVAGLANNTVLVARDGTELGIEDTAAPVVSPSGQLFGTVLVFHDVTEQRRLASEITFKATHDVLTGLVNRAEFESRLRRVVNTALENATHHALLYIDLDQFKVVNDACGHAVGDALLQQIAKMLEDSVRVRDTVARLGGDEFGVILEHCGTDEGNRIARQICGRLENYRFVHDGRKFRVGASIGLVPVDNRWGTISAVLQAADSACYAAKEAGRNRVHAWFDSDQAIRARHGDLAWVERIEHALDENRIVLHFQRIMPIDGDSEDLHVEILARIRDSDGSLIQPDAFLPSAERYHLVPRLDRRILELTIDWLSSHPHYERIGLVGVNLSGASIGDRAFIQHVLERLKSVEPTILQRLCLEVTETSTVINLNDAAYFIDQLHGMGVKVALDDFGAGASSFGYLKSLRVDYLKIDGRFVRQLLDDPLDRIAVRCFIDVARQLGIRTIAEYVERPETLQLLHEMGADFAQGFLLHTPEPLAPHVSGVG